MFQKVGWTITEKGTQCWHLDCTRMHTPAETHQWPEECIQESAFFHIGIQGSNSDSVLHCTLSSASRCCIMHSASQYLGSAHMELWNLILDHTQCSKVAAGVHRLSSPWVTGWETLWLIPHTVCITSWNCSFDLRVLLEDRKCSMEALYLKMLSGSEGTWKHCQNPSFTFS